MEVAAPLRHPLASCQRAWKCRIPLQAQAEETAAPCLTARPHRTTQLQGTGMLKHAGVITAQALIWVRSGPRLQLAKASAACLGILLGQSFQGFHQGSCLFQSQAAAPGREAAGPRTSSGCEPYKRLQGRFLWRVHRLTSRWAGFRRVGVSGGRLPARRCNRRLPGAPPDRTRTILRQYSRGWRGCEKPFIFAGGDLACRPAAGSVRKTDGLLLLLWGLLEGAAVAWEAVATTLADHDGRFQLGSALLTEAALSVLLDMMCGSLVWLGDFNSAPGCASTCLVARGESLLWGR